jgi:uncharacterized protein (DUF1778 family)
VNSFWKARWGGANEILAEHRHFHLDAKQWEAFQAALDAPPRPLTRFERLLQKPGMFDGPEQET